MAKITISGSKDVLIKGNGFIGTEMIIESHDSEDIDIINNIEIAPEVIKQFELMKNDLMVEVEEEIFNNEQKKKTIFEKLDKMGELVLKYKPLLPYFNNTIDEIKMKLPIYAEKLGEILTQFN